MRPSLLDKCYRKTVVLKMFTDGWGKTSDLIRLVELRRKIINKKTGFDMVKKNHPIKIIKMASLAATFWPKQLVLVPCLSWSTASVVFTEGVLSESVDWDSLRKDYMAKKEDLLNIPLLTTTTKDVPQVPLIEPTTEKPPKVEGSLEQPNPKSVEPQNSPPPSLSVVNVKPTTLLEINNLNHPDKVLLKNTASGKTLLEVRKNLRHKECVSFMNKIMDEFTHLKNYPKPYDPSLITIFCAECDAYVPREQNLGLQDIWPGSTVVYLRCGHVGAYVWYRKTMLFSHWDYTTHFVPGQNNRVDAGNTLALALWGRSKVLFATGEFSLALSDLQMALKENLPESYKGDAFSKMTLCYKALGEPGKSRVCWDLTKKLLRDKNKLTLLEEDLKKDLAQAKKSSRKILPTITGRAHEVFKNASKKISVEHSKDKGRFVVANESIKTGETLVVEPPYAACLLPECFGTHCHHCFERLINPIGCPTCSNVAFCNQTCRDEALSTYHQYECKFLDLLIGSGMSILSHTALRSITQKPLQESLGVHKDTSKEMVYSLCTLSKLRPANDFLQRTLMGAFLLRCLQKSGFFGKDTNRVVPNDDEYKIGELLLFHLQMLQFNAHEIYETRHGADHRFRNAKAAYIGVAVYPTVALFNHDCYPAVTRYFVGKNIVINAVRPLKPHDVIAENYGPIFTRKTLPERQRSLSSRYWFHCKCLPCEQNWPSLDTGLDNIAKRLRCPNGKCPNSFTLPLQKDTIICPKCNRKGSLKEALVKLEECEKNYGRAFELLDQQKPEEALGILCQTIDTFHSISSPPHRDTHLAQEILRACMADSGNAYECLIKM